MRQTLFFVSHDFLAYWSIPLWMLIIVILIAIQASRGKLQQEIFGTLVMAAVGFAVIWFVLPGVELIVPDPKSPADSTISLGLPVRGFGAMMLLGTIAGVGLAIRRATQLGVQKDFIFNLAFWMFLGGIIGARAFYVLQYWEDFQAPTLMQTLIEVVNTTKGGLVVYGSLIGALLAASIVCYRQRFPSLALGDLIAPSMVIGLALGRIGCFLNGCCYGGETELMTAVRFPPASPPYQQQLLDGRLLGVQTEQKLIDDPNETSGGGKGKLLIRKVVSVAPNSFGEKNRIAVGDNFEVLLGQADNVMQSWILSDDKREIGIVNLTHGSIPIRGSDLPDESLSIHPTQLYSSLDAFLICAFLWLYFPFRRGDGEVIGWMLVIYSITRFLIEIIRDDEGGQFGTSLTISQWVSLAIIGFGVALVVRAWLGKAPISLPYRGTKALADQ